MSDDIDIEEHDILDNPHIRNIFPDLSVVKKEISEFFNEAVQVKQEHEPSESTQNQQMLISNTFSNNNETPSVGNYSNSLLPSNIAVKNLNNTKPVEFKPYQTNITFQKNKIIIGSKPTKYKTPNTTANNQVRFPKVVLRDVKSYLEKNKRYCKNCLILFPASSRLCEHKRKRQVVTENHNTTDVSKPLKGFECRLCQTYISSKSNLTRHYKNVHKRILTFKSVNQMVKIETNNSKQQDKDDENKKQSTHHCKVCQKTFNSLNNLQRHNRNVHLDDKYKVKGSSTKSNINDEVVRNTRANTINNTDTECFHCKRIFPDHKSLIEHVYEILEPKSNKITGDQNHSREKKKFETSSLSVKKNVGQGVCQTKNNENPKHQLKSQFKSKETIASSSKNIAKIKTRLNRLDKTPTKKKAQKNESHNKNPSERKVQLRARIRYTVNRTDESDYDEKPSETPLNEINHNKSLHCQNINRSTEISKQDKANRHVYKCPHCSYCFLIANNYIKHIKLKHDAKVPKLGKKLFDPQCNYCESRNANVLLHNRHLSKDHPNIVMKKVTQHGKATIQENVKKNHLKAYAFKSVLFRCVRCDIHFLSVEAAKDHDGHMEILINWKCYICDLILKKSDEKVHLKQHTFSKNITVQVLDAEGLSNLLYNCIKCTIHFSEQSYIKHYQNCEKETAASVYCKFCDILINETDSIAHERAHNDVEDFSLHVVTSDIIFFEKLKGGSEIRVKCMDKNSTVTPKRVLNETFVYCPTCECYMTLVNKIHCNRRCVQLIKHVCDVCGLVMTNKCIDTHRKYHKIKDFNLQDLNFLDMDGKIIKPPIPAYPQCSICKVYFTSKVEINKHVCDDTKYFTCEVCQINLSDAAFKLHMPYHEYTLKKTNKITVKLPKSNKTAKTSSKLNKANVASVEANITITSKNNPTDTDSPTKALANNSNSLKSKELLHDNIGTQFKIPSTGMAEAQNESTDDIDFNFVVIFSCKNCLVALDTYDKVVEHCQNHVSSKKSPSHILLCSICHLKFDTTLESHKHVHDDPQKPIKKLTFDVKYFSFDNDVWLNHVFQSLSAKIINKIIGKSIYKDEHRLRLQHFQPGPPHLTVYKCAKCSNIIPTESLLKHAGCKDPNIRNISCSYCGLTFISSITRNQHQQIHMRYSGINLKSYNIVLFNQDSKQKDHSKITLPSQYILYQCRNCNGLIDKSDKGHKCDINDLKICPQCGLLIYGKEFNNHLTEHKRSPNFCTKYMKVILIGTRNETEVVNSKTLTPSFDGIMYDYTLYQCKNCEICVKNEQLISKHVCILGIYRFQCHKCDLYFTEKTFKPHLKTHSIDSEFKKDNINIVQFNLKRDLAKTNMNDQNENKSDDSTEQDNKETGNSVSISNNNDNEPNNEETTTISLYKCKCELHFVEKLNAIKHYEKCSPNQRLHKQICTKCDLLFNPNELFTHLVNHHGDKSSNCKRNIVEISDENIASLVNLNLYKCSKCTLHFCSKHVADSHFLVCEGVMKDSEECEKCNTTFDKTSFNCEEHGIICGKEYQVVLIDEIHFKISPNSTETPTT